jgi:polyvinyl alcohol dehydrogenase (cytochrome)
MNLSCLLLIGPALAFAADDPYAAALFQKTCATCHQAGGETAARIPQISVLKTRTPNSILRTLESGVMKQQAAVLSTNERQAVANWLGTPVTLERRREEISNSCPAGAAWKNNPGWSGWSPGLVNTRFQSAQDAGLTAADVPRLQPKWVFAFPDTTLLRSQPAVYRGREFVGGQDGSVYSLDAATGCVHWSTIVQAEVRSGITVAEVAGKPTVFFGDSSGYYYALDGETGKQVLEAATGGASCNQRECHARVLPGAFVYRCIRNLFVRERSFSAWLSPSRPKTGAKTVSKRCQK